MKKKIKNPIRNLHLYLPRLAILLVILLLAGAGVAFAQFARQTGDVGYGYGYGYGWDRGLVAGIRNTENTWTHYTISNSDIFNTTIVGVEGDLNSDNLWVGLKSNGVQLFDGVNWTHYKTPDIPSDSVSEMAVDSNGDFWFTSRDRIGVVHFDGSTWSTHNTISDPTLPSNSLGSIAFDSQDNLWTFVNDGVIPGYGLLKYDGVSWTAYTESNSDIPGNLVQAIAIDDEDNIWLSSMDGAYMGQGLIRFDGGSTWTVFNTGNSDIEDDLAFIIEPDQDGNIWYAPGIPGAGAGRFDGTNWFYYTSTNSDLIGSDSGDIFSDSLGGVWVATADYSAAPPESRLQRFKDGVWTRYDNQLPIGGLTPGAGMVTETSSRNVWFSPDRSNSNAEIAQLTQSIPASQYAYGYGYGYMPENTSGGSSISWNNLEQRYESIGINLHTQAGILIPTSGDFASTTGIQWLYEALISLPDGDAISIPAETIFNNGGLLISFAGFEADESLEPSETSSLPGTVLGDLSFGLPSTDLTSTNPVTIGINVGSAYDGQTLSVYHLSPESSSWSLLTTCIVGDVATGICIFSTTSFSSFAAVQSETSETNPTKRSTKKEPTTSSKTCIESSYNHNRTLQEGMTGDDVQALQQVLVDYEYLTTTPDGDFGILTANAVRTLQTELTLTPDGIVGPHTGMIIELLAHCGELIDDKEEILPTPTLEDTNYEQVQEAIVAYTELVEEELEIQEPLVAVPLFDEEPTEEKKGYGWLWWIVALVVAIGMWLKVKK